MAARRRRTRRARLDVSGTAKPQTVLIGHFPEGAINWPWRAIKYELRKTKKRKRKTAHQKGR